MSDRDAIAAELERANRSYYDDGESNLTDDQYDALAELVDISTLTAPPVGTPWPVVEHLHPMPGIGNVARSADEWRSTSTADAGWVSVKLDGLSVELVYRVGRLTNAILRGDGIRGEDVLHNVRHAEGVPPLIACQDNGVSIRCELVVSTNNIEIMNGRREADGRPVYKSRRGCVNVVRSKSASVYELSLLCAVVVDVVGVHPDHQTAFLESLVMRGVKRFQPVVHWPSRRITAWQRRTLAQDQRDESKYQLDGVVWRGEDGGLVKLKFDSTTAVTRVTNVVEQLGRTGVIAPVCEFEPVKLIGAVVKRASVHNAELVARELPGLGVGALVMVSRRGDVIPHVERVLEPSSTPWEPGDKCPSCGALALPDGASMRCSADPGECSGTVLGLLRKFCMELGIKGCSYGVLGALCEHGMTVPSELYSLTPDVLSEIEMSGGQRIGETRALMIVQEMECHRKMTLGELLGSVGVPGCAKSVMESIARKFPDPDQLMFVEEAELMQIDGIGPARAKAIAAYLDTRYADVIGPLLEVVEITKPSGGIDGLSFCITLGLSTGSRPQVEAKIRAAGGLVRSSVTKDLSYLVCNSPDENTTKLKRAKELGVPIISERKLIEMLSLKPQDIEPNPEDSF